jgi:hypothetical protein
MEDAIKVGQRNNAEDLKRLLQIKELARQIAQLAADNGVPDDPGENERLSAIAESMSKGLDLSYVKHLHRLPDIDADTLAVKSIGTDEIRGYMVVWGDADKVDIENEFFTPDTDFWDKSLSLPRPLTWDHEQDRTHKAHSVIGDIREMGDDDVGRWYVAQLKRNHKYRQAVDNLIAARAVGTSSDSAPQYVQREKAKSGATWLKQWPLFAAALTPSPAEPRLLDTVYWKSIDLDLPVVPDGTSALDSAAGALPDGEAERLRLLVELLKL